MLKATNVLEMTLLDLRPVPEQPAKTLILIDGHSLAYRMHFALERTNMRNSAGEPTWAVYGFLNAVFGLLQKIKPDAIAVSFDVSRITFRNELYPEYKGHRASMPDEMRDQMERVREAITHLGIPIFEKENFEADDVIGTLATRAAKEGFWVQILTGDQDAFQLVMDLDPENPERAHGGKIEVLIPPRMPREEMKAYDREAVFGKWAVYPEQVIDFKGLKGDTSDNIPGIPGVGDKTAAKLLAEYPTLEAIYENIDKLPANKLREKLETYKDQAFLSKTLATIDCAVDIDVIWDDCHLAIPDVDALLGFLKELEFNAFLKQAPMLLAPFLPEAEREALLAKIPAPKNAPPGKFSPTPAPVQSTTHAAPNRSAQAVLGRALDTTLHPDGGHIEVPYTLVTEKAQLDSLVALIQQYEVFALDVETTGLDVQTIDLVGIAISVGDAFVRYERPAVNLLKLPHYPESFKALKMAAAPPAQAIQNFYIPLRHSNETETIPPQLPEVLVLAALAPVLSGEHIVKLVHNAKFEANIFKRLGFPLKGLVFDTMIASYIHNPDRRHGLKSLATEVLEQPMAEIKALIGTGKKAITFDGVPLERAAGYAVCDTFITMELARYFLLVFDEKQTTLFYEVEMPLALVLAELEWAGVSLDTPYLSNLSTELDGRLKILETEIWALAGVEFNLNSPKQVGDVLFEKLGLASGKKTKSKTAYSTDVKVLEQLANEHEVVRKLLEYRQLYKLKSTYIDALPSLINPKTGRLHTSFNQTVTATGRLSSSNPNLQNIPIRSELGRLIRQAFVPEIRDGWSLLSADYSQIELRLLAHFSEDSNLVKAFNNNEDVHSATASLVFGMPIDKVTKEQRYRAKTVNFGVIYGQSPFGLAQQLKIPQVEAAQFIQLYFSRYGNVKAYIEGIKAEAHRTGKVETICGRTRDLSSDLNNSNRSIREFAERAAFNTPLQGSAADLMKVAMIRLQRELDARKLKSRMILQVHDELVIEVSDDERTLVESLVRDAMVLDQPLKVPLEVDVYIGPSWME